MPDTTSRAAASVGGPGEQDFSLVLGGALFQLMRRMRLCDDSLGLVHRRIICAALVMWAPLLVLSALQGGLVGPDRRVPFLSDVGLQVRFLVATPLLIAAEVLVHRRFGPMVSQFRVRNLIQPNQAARFAEALNETARLRDSALAEVLLIALTYVVGVFFTFRRYTALGSGAWYASASGGDQLSSAGLWFVFVSLPFFQFLLLRWYLRLFIWTRFLWRVSRLDLNLNVTHPDKAGGLGFLGGSIDAFVPIGAAHGVLVAGVIADRMFRGGITLGEFQLDVFGEAIVLVFVFAGPLALFWPLLAQVKRTGLREYGALAQEYVQALRGKWLAGDAPAGSPLIGSEDIKGLADLANSYAVAEQTRIIPIGLKAVLYFVAAVLAPTLPLALTMVPAEKLIERLIKMVL